MICDDCGTDLARKARAVLVTTPLRNFWRCGACHDARERAKGRHPSKGGAAGPT